ncbi:MAG: hypothetical protein AAGH78_06755 [Cyanobacteria bacterium P01_H01_bin.58]
MATKKKYRSRLEISNFSGIAQDAIKVEQFLRGQPDPSKVLKTLVLEALEDRFETRLRQVVYYAQIWNYSFARAWVSIVAGRTPNADLEKLSDEQFANLMSRLENKEYQSKVKDYLQDCDQFTPKEKRYSRGSSFEP